MNANDAVIPIGILVIVALWFAMGFVGLNVGGLAPIYIFGFCVVALIALAVVGLLLWRDRE